MTMKPRPQDEKHLQGLHAVQEALTDHGMAATSGLLSAMPADTDCKVIIHDRWFWDTYWYLCPWISTFTMLAPVPYWLPGMISEPFRDIRRTPEFMANELIAAIFSVPAVTKSPNHPAT